jgi:protein-S-isoprenylcysteine O-methyltransferase Ste14
LKLKLLIGSGDKIILFTLPFLIVGLLFNIMSPSLFSIGGPTNTLYIISIIVLIPGIINWLWCVVLIMIKVPKNQLITSGPYRIVKHPLYTGVAFLVLPWLGFVINTWLGILVGVGVYIGSKVFAAREEEILASTFEGEWVKYSKKVLLPWL